MFDTMAIEITEETYPIAIAVLPVGFLLVPKLNALGAYLVINEISIHESYSNETTRNLALNNVWMSATEFFENYETPGSRPAGKFFPVSHRPVG